MKYILFITLLCTSLITASEKENSNGWNRFWDYMYDRFELIPDIHLEADLSTFFFHKNSDFYERYLLENNTNLDISLVGFKEFVYFNWEIEFQTGMGRNQGENVLFDPADINYGIVPIFEFRFKPVNLQIGMNHHCFHEIDQKVEPTVYWNKPFIGVGSKNMRHGVYWETVRLDENWNWKNRYSWFVEAGFYVKNFGDIISESAINGANDRELEFRAISRVTPLRSRYWLYNIVGETLVGTWRNDSLTNGDAQLFWQQRFGIELVLRKGQRGALVFADFFLDDMPIIDSRERFSKDKMLQTGFRFFI